MQCPQCGFLMSAFDADCPRCKNLGLPQVNSAKVIDPVTSVPNLTVTNSLSPEPFYNDPLRKTLAFGGAAIVFCLGFFSPWVTFSLFGFDLGISGSAFNANFWVILLIIGTVGITIFEHAQEKNIVLDIAKTLFCTATLVFPAYKTSYLLAAAYTPGYGLMLMLAAAVFMFYLALMGLSKGHYAKTIFASISILVVSMILGKIKGYSQKASYANIFSGNAATSQYPTTPPAQPSLKGNNLTNLTPEEQKYIEFAKTAFQSLARGDLSAEDAIDWETFQSVGQNVAMEYSAMPNDMAKANFRKSFIASFSSSFQSTGASADSLKNWRVQTEDSSRIIIAADTPNKTTLLITVSKANGNQKISALNIG